MKLRVIESFVLLTSFFLGAFASRSEIDSEDLENGGDFAMNDFDFDENDFIIRHNKSNDYEYFRPVPRVQFDNAFRISITILCIFKFMESELGIYKMLSAASALTLPIQLQSYFGYYLRLKVALFPLTVEKIDFKHKGLFVSFNRWLFTPLMWITESLLLLSDEEYTRLRPYVPEKDVIILLFVIQALHYCGAFDILISLLIGPQVDRKK